MKLFFITNLGTRDAHKLGLDASQCTYEAIVEVPDDQAEKVRGFGVAVPDAEKDQWIPSKRKKGGPKRGKEPAKPAPKVEPKPEPKPKPSPKVDPIPKVDPKPAPKPPAVDDVPPDQPKEMTPDFKPKGK
jgi:hypothetical protein